MSYKQVKQYGYRDNLESGDPEKVIYGADFDGEFQAIEAAIDDKADKTDLDGKADLVHTHEIADVNGLQEALNNAGGAPAVSVGPNPPVSPIEGQQWLNNNDGYLYTYYDNAGNPTWMSVERET